MKSVNLNSLLQAGTSLEEAIFASYLKHHAISAKSRELSDLNNLVSILRSNGAQIGQLSSFYLGYKIPQIGKEFDLLRFGKTSVLNIELKSESTVEKIRAQLRRNRYYLGFLRTPIEAFAYESSTSKIYRLSDDGELEISDSTELLAKLTGQEIDQDVDPDSLFNPSDYLVSPFNSSSRFLADEYFLTHQQEEIKSRILSTIEAASEASFIGITGAAGTGKTLLTFDIAKNLQRDGKKVLVLHCGLLNQGHSELEKAGWTVASVKYYRTHNLGIVDLLIVDEAQRIRKDQLEDLISRVNAAACACIFSFDKAQTLASWEEASDTAGRIGSIPSIVIYRLSEKIRTNNEIAYFIKMLFNRRATAASKPSPNITINYFDNSDDAKTYLSSLDSSQWEVLRFTPSQYKREHHENYYDPCSRTSHQVIGQEFEGVAIAVDRFFAYDSDGNLIYKGGAYYAPPKMLFQNITRARRRLNLVVINNQEILERCLAILS
jgi:hypothetical protein